MNKLQKGFTLIEIVIGITVVSIMSAITVPAGMNAYRKAEANTLQQEFDLLQSSVIQLKSMGASHLPLFKVTVEDTRDYIVPLPNSVAFTEIRKMTVAKPTLDDGYTPDVAYLDEHFKLYLQIRFDKGTNLASLHCTRRYNQNIQPTLQYYGLNPSEEVRATTPLGSGVRDLECAVEIPNVRQGNISCIEGIFNSENDILVEDFINSPKGLNLKDFRVNFKNDMDDNDLLAILLGGRDRSTWSMESLKFTSLPEFNSPLELTKADVLNLKTLESNSSIKYSTDLSKGQLFYVTRLMSKKEFIEYFKTTITDTSTSDTDDDNKFKDENGIEVTSGRYCDLIFDSSLSDAELDKLLGEMYDIVAEGFKLDTPVYIPYKFTDAVKCIESDLEHGYYRP